jgi:spermidine synthase
MARLRPPAARLTEFYLLMSLGGVIGGACASLVAPNIFTSVVEYPGLIVAAFVAVALSAAGGRLPLGRPVALAVAGAALVAGIVWLSGGMGAVGPNVVVCLAVVLVLVLFWLLRDSPMGIAVVMAGVTVTVPLAIRTADALLQTRSFYGVISVRDGEGGQSHVLYHGSTAHGLQIFADADGRPFPGPTRAQAYYYPEGTIGTAVAKLRAAKGSLDGVALVGLGAGAMMCLKQPGESWRFYEIDPEMVRIASDARNFTYLQDCGPPADIVIGDGRLRLQDAPDGSYDLIVLDAFSSDSIPAHLLTVEALDLYLAKLRPGGLVVYHISNRHMDLSGVIEGAARARGLEAWHSLRDKAAWAPNMDRGELMSLVAVVGKTPGTLASFDTDPKWQRAAPDAAADPWTDDYSNVLGAIWRFWRMDP